MNEEKPNSDFLEPDLYHLDEDWIKQPKIFHEWSIKLNKAEKKLDDTITDLKLLEADLDFKIRNNPEKFGLPEKMTEAMIAKAILRHPKYEELLKKINKRKYRIGVLKSAVNSLHQKKAALENLVVLHGRDYFATPQFPKGEEGKKFKDQMENKTFKHKKKR